MVSPFWTMKQLLWSINPFSMVFQWLISDVYPPKDMKTEKRCLQVFSSPPFRLQSELQRCSQSFWLKLSGNPPFFYHETSHGQILLSRTMEVSLIPDLEATLRRFHIAMTAMMALPFLRCWWSTDWLRLTYKNVKTAEFPWLFVVVFLPNRGTSKSSIFLNGPL